MKSIHLFQHFCFLFFLAVSFAANAQDNKVVIGSIDSLQSNILGEQRKIWVHVPDGGTNTIFSPQRYPVVYLLDGDGHFSSVVGMIQQLSAGGNNLCPKMIVVGIPNTDRTRDLTPTHVDADPPYMDSTSSKTSGGGENFIAFIEKELMPYIEAKYPAAPYKMLIGHSFGGLAVMQTFVHHTDLFNAYICIDPSMWWDNQKLLKQAQKALAEKQFKGKSLFLGIANTLEEGMDIKTVQKDTTGDSKHIRSILALQAAFEKNKQNGLQYSGKYYPDDTHGSVPFITQYDALRFFFDFFPLKLSMKDFTDSTSALADKYRSHFASLSKKMGYQIKPDEAEINFMGYEFLRQEHYKKAEDLFLLNLDNYPESFNVYDSYADYFIAKKDTANAIIQLKKALSKKENEGSRKKLEALEGGSKASRYLREVNLSGSGYALGLQHGQQLKKEIGEIVGKWKKSVESQLNKPADQVVKAFFEYARFDEAIKKWTPELYEEVRGIADGSGQAFNDIMVHNLLDEFWVWQDALENHHCSGIGVPARDGNPGYIAQNMDLESYTDGYQVLLRLAKTDKTPEQLILTYPGCIATNGLNETGIGACMNTLMQLKGAAAGLPVAFIVRRILNSTDKEEVLHFIQNVPHASGQNYILGIRGEVYDFEASANKVVRFDPKNANGTVYHTNHPIANDDLKDWYKAPVKGNSAIRLASVQGRIANRSSISDADIKAALRAKDDPNNPVCRTFNRWGGTFGSVVMTLTGNPKLQITAGPPDESEYKEVLFSTVKTKEVTLMVSLPESYNTAKKPYPVLYLIHGSNQTVEEIASMCRGMHQDKGVPEMIIVGVDISDDNLDRMTDPQKYDKFLSYVEQELMPAIAKQYRTNGRSLLYERSLEGSLALYTFLTKPALFNGYVAASKQWYEDSNDYFTGLASKALLTSDQYKGRKIFLATLNGAYNNNNIPEVDRQMTAFAKLLESRSGGHISAKYQAFDDWGITPQPGFSDGLLFVSKTEAPTKPKTSQLTMTQAADGKWVIIDSNKEMRYEVFFYDNGPDFPSEGLIRVVKNGKIGYANAKTYAIVIEPQFDCAFPFENGKAKVSNNCKTVKEGEHSFWTSDAWQYVDKKGRTSLPPDGR